MLKTINEFSRPAPIQSTISEKPAIATKPTVAPTAAQPIVQKLPRAPKSTSLKDLMNRNEEKKPTYAKSNIEQQETTPFGSDDLIRCWDAYAETIEKKVHLKNTMINCKPILQNDFKFEVVVHNPGQEEELLNNNASILNALRMQLKNSKIQMHVRIDETNEKHLAYTSKEKFDLLKKINPALAKLKDEFNLTLD